MDFSSVIISTIYASTTVTTPFMTYYGLSLG